MTDSSLLKQRRAEFEAHVWNHADDAFQLAFDRCDPLGGERTSAILAVVASIGASDEEDVVIQSLRVALDSQPDLIFPIMQLVGLTRNKIVQDLKGALSDRSIAVPQKPDMLHKNNIVWPHAASYLARRLRMVLLPITRLKVEDQILALECVNQATWPGWIRQERAKRQGHEAERRLAHVLDAVGIPFEPREKLNNPLCSDIQIDEVSYDLIVPGESKPQLCFKSTVHTSNIGQYGESKDALEIEQAAKSLSRFDPRPTLMALIDGVGFRSNRAGLDGVLENSDEFCQFQTLWKAVVVAASVLKQKIELELKDADYHEPFLRKYGNAIVLTSFSRGEPGLVIAGEARLRRYSV